MKKEPNVYSDLDLSFSPHPLTGDLVPKKNAAAIKRSIRAIFMMESFDIPFTSDKHSGVARILFENPSHLTQAQVYTQIDWVIKVMEPRVSLVDLKVDISSTGQAYEITVTYKIKSLGITDSFDFAVQRIR